MDGEVQSKRIKRNIDVNEAGEIWRKRLWMNLDNRMQKSVLYLTGSQCRSYRMAAMWCDFVDDAAGT